MYVLALDTSSSWLNLCFYDSESLNSLIVQKEIGLKHDQHLILEIEKILKDAGVDKPDLLVAANGPGSFTGVRIALATVKGLSLGWDCPFVLEDVLSIYKKTYEKKVGSSCVHSLVVIPRVRNSYFWRYERGDTNVVYGEGEAEGCKALLNEEHSELVILGSAALDFKEIVPSAQFIPQRNISPKVLAEEGFKKFLKEGGASSDVGAFYLRASEAERAKVLT